MCICALSFSQPPCKDVFNDFPCMGEIALDDGVEVTTGDSTGENASGADEGGVDSSISADSATQGSAPRIEVASYIASEEFSTYECKYSFDIADNTRDPDARMELVGTVNVQENDSGDVEYFGQVKNTGVKGLVFGKLYFVTRDTANSIVDASLTFVNGDTVTLDLIHIATDTALKIGSTGSFSAYTRVPFSNYGQHSVILAWDDSEITDNIARKSDRPEGELTIDAEAEKRIERITSMRMHWRDNRSLASAVKLS